LYREKASRGDLLGMVGAAGSAKDGVSKVTRTLRVAKAGSQARAGKTQHPGGLLRAVRLMLAPLRPTLE